MEACDQGARACWLQADRKANGDTTIYMAWRFSQLLRDLSGARTENPYEAGFATAARISLDNVPDPESLLTAMGQTGWRGGQ